MLKLTRKLEYALIALRHMQMNEEKISSTKQISKNYSIPLEILAKTLQHMSKLGYINAVKGPYGGYKIHKKIIDVNLTKFIEDLEGPVWLVNCFIEDNCSQLNNCNIRKPINQINDNIRSVFNKINLNEIIQ